MSFAIEKQQKDLQNRYWNRAAAHHQGLGTSSGPKGRGFVVQLPSLDCQEQKRRGLSVEFDSSAIDVGRASQRRSVTDRFAVGQSPLGHGRHIVAISISIILNLLSAMYPRIPHTPQFHQTFLLLPLPSQLPFVPYPLASSWLLSVVTCLADESSAGRMWRGKTGTNSVKSAKPMKCLVYFNGFPTILTCAGKQCTSMWMALLSFCIISLCLKSSRARKWQVICPRTNCASNRWWRHWWSSDVASILHFPWGEMQRRTWKIHYNTPLFQGQIFAVWPCMFWIFWNNCTLMPLCWKSCFCPMEKGTRGQQLTLRQRFFVVQPGLFR